jgi:hypothetical protein
MELALRRIEKARDAIRKEENEFRGKGYSAPLAYFKGHSHTSLRAKARSAPLTRSSAPAARQRPDPKRDTRSSEERILQYIFNWNRDSVSPLHVLSRSAFPTLIQEALKFGMRANISGGLLQSTPLHEAVKCGLTTNAHLLLEAKASVDSVDSLKRTPLSYASQAGNLDMVHLLLRFNANTSISDWYFNTPLHEAARMGHLGVIRALLESP